MECFEEGSQEADSFSAGGWEIFLSLVLQIGGALLSDPYTSSSSARRSYQTQTHLPFFDTLHTHMPALPLVLPFQSTRGNKHILTLIFYDLDGSCFRFDILSEGLPLPVVFHIGLSDSTCFLYQVYIRAKVRFFFLLEFGIK